MELPGTIKRAVRRLGLHRIVTRPAGRSVRVESGGEVVAASDGAIALEETGNPTRFYLPREDVRLDRLTRSDTTARCPFKGAATYWSTRSAQDAFWAYEAPSEPEARPIAGHLAPDPRRVDVFVDGARIRA